MLSDPRKTSTRRRIEWPSQDLHYLRMIKTTQAQNFELNLTPAAKQNAIDILGIEEAKCDRDAGVLYNMGIFD